MNLKPINTSQILKQEYSLSDQDIKRIQSRFIRNEFFNNFLFIGQTSNKKTSLVIGAPCIRKGVEVVSLNIFSQIFIPLKIESIQKRPCKIFIGIREEIILQPNLFDDYQRLGHLLENAIKKIAQDLNISVKIVNTSSYKYDSLINNCVKELGIQLSAKESTYLFNISRRKILKPLHSQLRVISNKRMIACNTSYVLQKMFGFNSYLIVEDIEQYFCFSFSQQFNRGKVPNFLTLLPLPNIYTTMSMFKADKEERFLLNQSISYYKDVFKKSDLLAINTYKQFLNFFENQPTTLSRSFESFLKTIKKISSYFI